MDEAHGGAIEPEVSPQTFVRRQRRPPRQGNVDVARLRASSVLVHITYAEKDVNLCADKFDLCAKETARLVSRHGFTCQHPAISARPN